MFLVSDSFAVAARSKTRNANSTWDMRSCTSRYCTYIRTVCTSGVTLSAYFTSILVATGVYKQILLVE